MALSVRPGWPRITRQLFLTVVRYNVSGAVSALGGLIGYAADRILSSFFDAEHGLICQRQKFGERVRVIREGGYAQTGTDTDV